MYCWIMNCWTFGSCVMKKHNQFQGQWIKMKIHLEQVLFLPTWNKFMSAGMLVLISLVYFLGYNFYQKKVLIVVIVTVILENGVHDLPNIVYDHLRTSDLHFQFNPFM